jgi:Ricin-type beta-trefoil lectin domain-like
MNHMTTHNVKRHRFNVSPRLLAALPVLLGLCLIFPTARGHASQPNGDAMVLTSIAAAPNGGYWIQVDGGSSNNSNGGSRTIAIDGAPPFENIPDRGSIAAIPGKAGYWVVNPKGHIYARGTAPELCAGELSNCSSFTQGTKGGVVTAAATPDGRGLWAVGRYGQVWAAGTAQPFGDVTKDSQTPTGIAPTPTGQGYYIVLSDGGVYSFGDAKFFGSTGGKKPGGHDATGLALSLNANGAVDGYWMVFDDGGVFTFGQAPFLGSSGGNNGGFPVTGIAARFDRRGYAWVHNIGSVVLSRTINVLITSKAYGTAIDVPNGTTLPGTTLELLQVNDATSQQWEIRPTTPAGNVVQVVNVNSGLCINVTGPSPNEATIIQWPCKGSTNQLWTMITDSNGATQFVYSGKPLVPPYYTLAGYAGGRLFLEFYTNDNPGWTVTAAKPAAPRGPEPHRSLPNLPRVLDGKG